MDKLQQMVVMEKNCSNVVGLKDIDANSKVSYKTMWAYRNGNYSFMHHFIANDD